jgi:serine protease Do
MKRNLAVLILAAVPMLVPTSAPAQVISTPRVQIFKSGGVYMGVGVLDVNAERMTALKLKEERGVEIASVSSDSPAAKAGLKIHDVILDYNGTRIEGVDQFRRLISETPAGRTVKLQIVRDGATQTVSVKMEERSGMMHHGDDDNSWAFVTPMPPAAPMAPMSPTAPPAPPTPRAPRARAFTLPNFDNFDFGDNFVFGGMPRLGISGEEVGSQLGEFFGVPDKQGVLVREVSGGSAAEKAGIKAGDVIIKVDGKRVQDMSDIRDAVRDNQGKSFPVVVIRSKHETTLTVKIEKAESHIPATHV